jgi:anti-anti-sigma factor
VLALGGVLDVVTVSELQPLFERALADEGPTIVLDVASLRRIDSSGVVAIVALTREARASGRVVRVRGLEGQPLDVFRLFRLDLMLDLDDGPPAHAAS